MKTTIVIDNEKQDSNNELNSTDKLISIDITDDSELEQQIKLLDSLYDFNH